MAYPLPIVPIDNDASRHHKLTPCHPTEHHVIVYTKAVSKRERDWEKISGFDVDGVNRVV